MILEIISWRPDARGHVVFQLFHDLLGALPQPQGEALIEGCQQLDMTTGGVMDPVWGFMNEATKVFLSMYDCIEMW